MRKTKATRWGVGVRAWPWACGVALLISCGGNAQGDGPSAPSGGAGMPGTGSGSGNAQAAGAAGASKPPPSEQVCANEGERREPRADEKAKYCVCEKDLLWRCYGPAPDDTQAQAACSDVLVNQGSNGSCLVIWQACSDGKLYSVSCVDRLCYCLIQGEPTAELEPRDSCPESLTDFNETCGWQLKDK